MRKKVIGVLLTIAMTMTMTACGGSGNAPAADSSANAPAAETDAAGEKSADAIHLTLAHADTETNSMFGPTMTQFADRVAELTEGAVIIDVYPNGQLGTHAEEVSGIQNGTIDFSPVASTFVANFCPNVAVFDMPFLFNDLDQVWATLDSEVGEMINSKLIENNIEPLVWWGLGFRYVTTSETKPVKNVDDIKGLRIRIMQSAVYQAMFEALGADPVPMDFSELYTALQQGTVDGQENPYTQILSSNFWEVTPVIIKTEHAFSPTVLMMSPYVADKVSEEQLALIRQAAEECKDDFRQATVDINAAALDTLLNEKGCTLVESIDKSEFQKKVEPVYEKFTEYADMVEKIRALAK